MVIEPAYSLDILDEMSNIFVFPFEETDSLPRQFGAAPLRGHLYLQLYYSHSVVII